MDNFDLKKYLAEGKLLKEELTPLQQYVYDYEKEVSGEDNAKEFLDGIKKLNTPNDVYDYYAFERNWEGDSDLEGDLENIYNQVLDKFKSKNENKMDNFDLKKYLAEGKLNEEEITWDIDAYDDAADVSDAADDFLPEVKRLIQLEIGDEMIDGELEEYIEVSNDYYYRKARKNAKGSDPENISITAKAFADNVIENYKEDQ